MSRGRLLISAFVILFILITVSVLSFSSFMHFGLNDRAEGVESLSICFEEESIENYTFTKLAETLNLSGYPPHITKIIDINSNETILWDMRINWPIPDGEYPKNYATNLTVMFSGVKENDTIILRSPMIVYFESACMVSGAEKKEMDKNLTKQAAFDIAEIIGVNLDWDSHEYTIAWMTMTSEGYYEEK